MRKSMLAVFVVLVAVTSLVTHAADQPPVPREGITSYTSVVSATFRSLAQGKDRVQLSWEALGAIVAVEPSSLFKDATVRCVGSLYAVNGAYESHPNACVLTLPDGDQFFTVETGAGRLGGASRGTGTIVGGTGKLAGITGTSQWTRRALRPAAEGTFQVAGSGTLTYKLP